MEDKKVLKAEELSEEELEQAGGFSTDTIMKSQKNVKSVVSKSEKAAVRSVKALTDNKSVVEKAKKARKAIQ